MEIWKIAIVCAVGFGTTWFSIVTGGGGLITTALMLSLGMPAGTAVATLRFSVLGVDAPALLEFHQAGKIHYRLALPLALVAGASALAGAEILSGLESEHLKRIVAGCMLLMVVLTAAFPRVGAESRPLRRTAGSWMLGSVLIAASTVLATIGGGGAGTLYSYVLVLVFGETFLESAGTRKIVGIAMTVAASISLAFKGLVDYSVALPLMICSGAGGWLGSRFMIARGDRAVRWIFLAGVAAMGLWAIFS
jgi:hypothetical protein